METRARWLCLVCGAETAPGDLDACPNCGDRGFPVDVASRVDVSVTWVELGLLVQRAERCFLTSQGARGRSTRALYGIAERLEAQHPTRSPLTLAGRVAARLMAEDLQ